MVLYLILIAVFVLLIATVGALAFSVNFFYTLGFTLIATVAVIAVDGFVCAICRFLPKNCANHESKVYTVSAKEKNFYEKLKIRKWKDKIPEIGHFTGFRKNKIADPKSVEYLDRFLLEACYGELGHFFSLFFGFAILLLGFIPIFPYTGLWLAISLPVAVINIFMNLPSIFTLRYNSYKLEILRKSNLKKQKRAKKSLTEEAPFGESVAKEGLQTALEECAQTQDA